MGLRRRLEHRHLDDEAGDAPVGRAALPFRVVAQEVVVDRFDESVAEDVHREAERAHRLAVGDALLDLVVGVGAVRADRAVVDQRAPLDEGLAPRDRHARSLEAAARVAMAGAQLRDLAAAAGDRILVALAARLRVVERSESVRDRLDGVEFVEIVLERRRVGEAVALPVEAALRLVAAAFRDVRFGAEVGRDGDDVGARGGEERRERERAELHVIPPLLGPIRSEGRISDSDLRPRRATLPWKPGRRGLSSSHRKEAKT